MDWDAIAAQLLRAARGERSQLALSRRLGYRGNPVANWESRRRFPTAAVGLRICELGGRSVPDAFARFHRPAAAALGCADDEGVARWLDQLRGGASISDVAERAGLSRSRLSRWMSGETRPRLPDFLRLVEALTGRVSDLAAELVDIERVEALAAHHRRRTASRRLAFGEPWTEAVLRVIETCAYQGLPEHEPGYIADKLGIDRQTEARCLSLLCDAEVLSKRGEEPYRSVGPLSVEIPAGQAGAHGLQAHWSRVAAQRVDDARSEDLFSYNVVSLSREDLVRLRKMQVAYYQEVRSLVAASEPVEVAALVNLQLLSWR